MKITTLAQGTGVPASADSVIQRSSPDRIARAKAVAMGEEPQKLDSVADHQSKPNLKTIKMTTQVSTNRHDNQPAPEAEVIEGSPNPDTIELAKTAEETKPISPETAVLLKKQRALQVKERELAQREEALKAQETPKVDNSELIAKLKARPLDVLQEHGVTYEQLTEEILNSQSGSSVEISELRSELKTLKEELTGKFNERDQLQEQQVLSQFQRDTELLTSQGEQYEAIREAKAQKKVVELIHRNWKETGEVMDLNEAADLIENQLIDDSLPFAGLKKVQSRLQPKEVVQEQQVIQPPKPGTKIMRTLTNRDGATNKPVTRRERALAAFNGTFKRG